MNMPAKELVGHLHILSQSVKDFLDPWFESEALKVALATDGVIGTKGGPYTPGTAYVLLHHVMGGVGGKRGLWGFVRGGMGGVTQAMAASANSEAPTSASARSTRSRLVREGGLTPHRCPSRPSRTRSRARSDTSRSKTRCCAHQRGGDSRPRRGFQRRSQSYVLEVVGGARAARGFPRRNSLAQNRRRLDEDQPGARWPSGLHLPARLRARPSSQNHHSYLSHAGIHRTRLR